MRILSLARRGNVLRGAHFHEGRKVMSTAENGNGFEVSIALGVVAMQPVVPAPAAVAAEQMMDAAEQPPLAGGVQNSGGILNSDMRISREIVATTVQNSPVTLNTLDETAHAAPARTHFPAEILELPPQTKPGKPGPKLLITPQVAEQLCMIVSIGLSRRQAAAYLGISPGTICNSIARDPALGEQLRQAEELQLIHPELTIIAEARKNWRAASWYLAYKAKNARPLAETLSEEELEARHQAQMAEQRRANERADVFFKNEKPVREPAPEVSSGKSSRRRRG